MALDIENPEVERPGDGVGIHAIGVRENAEESACAIVEADGYRYAVADG